MFAGVDNQNYRGGKVDRACQSCGGTFQVEPWRSMKFCSRACYYAGMSGRAAAVRDARAGATKRSSGGWVLELRPGHPRADRTGYVRQHVLIAESALGRPLPAKAVVHHHNEQRDDNRHRNLVICQDQGYHQLIHARARVVRLGGNPNTDKFCSACERVRPAADFYRDSDTWNQRRSVCRECTTARRAPRRSA